MILHDNVVTSCNYGNKLTRWADDADVLIVSTVVGAPAVGSALRDGRLGPRAVDIVQPDLPGPRPKRSCPSVGRPGT